MESKQWLACIIARELGKEIRIADCRSVSTPKDLLPYLTNASCGSILLLAHTEAISKNMAVFLEPAITECLLHITLGEGLNSRTIDVKLRQFTMIATAVDSNAAPPYFQTYFESLPFGPVPHSALAQYICRHVKKVPHELALAIVEECNPTRANALQLTRRLIEYGNAVANGKLSRRIIRAALGDLGIEQIATTVADRSSKRVAIPANVRNSVWQRDGGKCVRCGSRVRLEFDHIVPVIKGGSNTARNIELLCESCNRRKGPNVGLFD